MTDLSAAWVKLALLSHGVAIDVSFSAWFGRQAGWVRRRNFYNSPVWDLDATVPQEIRLATPEGQPPVTVAVNVYGDNTWTLKADAESAWVVNSVLGVSWAVELVGDLECLRGSEALGHIANLYGGSALSFFSPRACYFFADGTQCRFCSLAGTAAGTSFANRLSPVQVRDAVAAVLEAEPGRVNQVMIVGGNERSLDTGFLRHVDLAQAASAAISAAGMNGQVSVHLVTMPPRDLKAIRELDGVPDVHVGFNLEAWDPVTFERIAPGKATDYGHAAILTALERLVDVVGEYRAHSILIAGLEHPASTLSGAASLAAMGVSPIINAFHSDVHSTIGLSVHPSYQQLAEVASGLSELHATFPIRPYWKGCGRNALDFEASHGLFDGEPPALDGVS
ncbi:radical SAM protein [Spirillospora sp. NPDC048819]|uniref:radical SAM protein n=1 Tax=Spirillospora sp. NPDC048819 TaxID=3155268 RepID=UPI0033FED27D